MKPTGKRRVIVACMFGLYDDELRTLIEMEGLDEYLVQIAWLIVREYERGGLAGVILAGGRTNQAKPELSEAETCAVRLLQLLNDLSEVPVQELTVLLEDESFSTAANLWNSTEMISRHMHSHNLSCDVVFVTDKPRVMKVWAMLRWLRKRFVTDERPFVFSVVGLNRLDEGNVVWIWLKQIAQAFLYFFSSKAFHNNVVHKPKWWVLEQLSRSSEINV